MWHLNSKPPYEFEFAVVGIVVVDFAAVAAAAVGLEYAALEPLVKQVE